MSSLKRCLDKLGIGGHRAAILRGNVQQYLKDGEPAASAAALAVQDAIRELQRQRASVIEQVRAAGGTVTESVDSAALMADPAPSEAQQESGTYSKGHVTIGPEGATMEVSIETPAGQRRQPEWAPLEDHYGYFKGTVGKDKDHLDVFIVPGTPNDYAGPVWVVNQMKRGSEGFDEHKVVYGEAQRAVDVMRAKGMMILEGPGALVYKRNYEAGWDSYRDPVQMTWAGFRAWASDIGPRGPKGGILTADVAAQYDRDAISAAGRTDPHQGGAAPQRDLDAAVPVPGTEAKILDEGIVVEIEKQRTVKLPRITIQTPRDAAMAFAQLNRWPRERFQMIGVGERGKIIAFYDLFAGTLTQTSVYPREIWTALYMTPGVKGVWFAHNHPSGVAQASQADELLTLNLKEWLRGRAHPDEIKYHGHIIIAGEKSVHLDNYETFDTPKIDPNAPASAYQNVPVMERVIRRAPPKGESLTSPGSVRDYLRLINPKESGLILMDAQHRAQGWWPMTLDQMRHPRWGENAVRTIQMIGRNNPAAAIAFAPEGTNREEFIAAAAGLKEALALADVKLLDAFEGAATPVSYQERGLMEPEAPYRAEQPPVPNESVLRRMAEYEGRMWFGAYSDARYRHHVAPAREEYNKLRVQADLPEVTDWTKRPELTGEQLLRARLAGRGNLYALRTVFVPPEIRRILWANDNLGFDSYGEAAQAILQHDDWQARWEIATADIAFGSPAQMGEFAEAVGLKVGPGGVIAVERDYAIALLERWKQGVQAMSRFSLRPRADEIAALEKRVDAAYERGDPKAEDLDAQLAEFKERASSFVEESLEDEATEDAEPSLELGLANLYAEWLGADDDTRALIVEGAREQFARFMGGEQPAAGDEAVLDAMRDSYQAITERRARVRRSYQLDERVPGMQAAAVEYELRDNEIAKALGMALHIARTPLDLPGDSVAELIARNALRLAKGMVQGSTGDVYLVASNLAPGEAGVTLLHEVVGHVGVRAVLPELEGKQYEAAMLDIYKSFESRIKNEAETGFLKPYALDLRHREHRIHAAEEFVAHTAETGELPLTLWERIVALLRKALEKMGFRRQWTTGEILDLLQRSRQAVLNFGESMGTMNGEPLWKPEQLAPVMHDERGRPIFDGAGVQFVSPTSSYIEGLGWTFSYAVMQGGKKVASATLMWEGKPGQYTEPSAVLYLKSTKAKGGTGTLAMAAIMRQTTKPIRVMAILPDAREFWEKMGVKFIKTEDYPDGILSEEAFLDATAARADTRAGRAQAAGAAGQAGGERPGATRGAPGGQALTPFSLRRERGYLALGELYAAAKNLYERFRRGPVVNRLEMRHEMDPIVPPAAFALGRDIDAQDSEIERLHHYLDKAWANESRARFVTLSDELEMATLRLNAMNDDLEGTLREAGIYDWPKAYRYRYSAERPNRNQFMLAPRADLAEVYGVRDGRLLGLATRPYRSGVWNIYLATGTNESLFERGQFRRLQAASINEVQAIFNREGLDLRVIRPQNVQLPDRSLFDQDWVAPRADTWLSRATIFFQNRLLLPRQYEEAIEKYVGPIPEGAKAHREARLAHPRAAGKIADFDHDYVEPIIDLMKEHRLTLKQVGSYAYARHAPERNAAIEEINPDNKAGSGMSDERATAVLAELLADLGPGRFAGLAEIHRLMLDINQHREDVWLEKGLVKEEAIRILRAKYPNYVPLKEIVDDEFANLRTQREIGGGFQVGRAMSQAFGRFTEAQAEFILPGLVAQAKGTIAAGENAEVLRSLIRLVQYAPNPAVWDIKKVVWKPYIDRETGEVRYAPRPIQLDANFSSRAISVPVDGERHIVMVNDERVAHAFKTSGTEIPRAVQLIGNITRFYATMATAANPEFVMVNLMRDFQQAVIRITGEQNLELASRVAKDVLPAMWGAFRGLREQGQISPDAGEWEVWYRRFIEAGGQVAYRGTEDAESQHKSFLAKLAEAGIFPDKFGGLEGLLLRGQRLASVTGAQYITGMVRDINGAVENALRLATFKNAIEAGWAEKDAAFLARNVTVDFNLKGDAGSFINSLYMFFNANIQGTAILVRSVMAHPKIQAAALFLLMLGALQEWWNRDYADKDPRTGRSYYDDIGEEIKQRNWVIMGPNRRDAILIPLPFGFNIFHNIGRQLMAVMPKSVGGAGKNIGEAAVDTFSATVNAVNPFGNVPASLMGALQLISPTPLDPVVQRMTNRNWMDKPIFPEKPRFAPPQAAAHTYFDQTPEHYIAVSQWLNRNTGGNEVRPGLIDPYPNVLQHWTNSIFGSAGATYARIGAFVGVKATDQEKDVAIREVPFLRRFYHEPRDFELSHRFYEYLNRAEVAHVEVLRAMQAGRSAEAAALREEYQFDRKQYGAAQQAERQVAELRREIARIRRDERMSRDQRRTVIEKLQGQARIVMQDFNARFEREGQ